MLFYLSFKTVGKTLCSRLDHCARSPPPQLAAVNKHGLAAMPGDFLFAMQRIWTFSISIRFPCRVCSLTNKTVGSPQATFIAKSEVSTRVLDTVKRFPKVDASKVREL